MGQISVLVVDDHPIFRQGVVDAFSLEADLKVIGQAATGEEALRLIRDLKPNVAVVDVNLPGLNGQQVARQVAAEKLPTRVILLTAYDDVEQRTHAMRGGAAAYCSKDVQPDHLVNVIKLVAVGKFVIGEQVLDITGLDLWLAARADSAARPYTDASEADYPLSGREMEVLSCISRGMSNKEIAHLLHISHQTVKNHVTAILRKLGVEDRTQAVIYAVKRGWVRLYQQNSHSQE
jgi:DNA-binding NarL/FixJ family response regulator